MSNTDASIAHTSIRIPIWRHPGVTATCRLLIAGLMAFAAVNKIIAPADFAQSIAAFQLLPTWAVNATAITLPWIEIVAALALACSPQLRPPAAILIGAMLAAFTGVIIWAIATGIDTECGCFGNGWLSGKANWWSVLRNLGFMSLLLIGMHARPASGRT